MPPRIVTHLALLTHLAQLAHLALLALLAACGSGAPQDDRGVAPLAPAPAPTAPTPAPAPLAPRVPAPTAVPRGSIAVGSAHACATAAGRVVCWGHADAGQLGPTIRADQPQPVRIDGLDDIAGVSAGLRGSCAWSKPGAVWCWGTFGATRQPVMRVPGIDDATQVAVEDALACALRRDGRVACWATATCNDRSPERPPSTRLRRSSDPPPEVACGLHEIGSIAGATEIAIAGSHGCALRAGAVWCWRGNRGQPFALPQSAGATSIAGARQRRLYSSAGFANQENLFALRDGTITGWTLNTGDAPVRAPFHAVEPGAIRISAGIDRVCAIGAAVTCSGEMIKREEHALAAVDLDVGGGARCVRTAGDRVACWGATGLIGDGGPDEIEVSVEVSEITDAVRAAPTQRGPGQPGRHADPRGGPLVRPLPHVPGRLHRRW